ncbi:MAG: hypothetical protein KAG97_00525 [Victivallales bacterium]|nr:hypothetical protein [Victivallales bacterium]
MTRKERLLKTMRGDTVDRPAVSFYEINGTESTNADDPFNIYSDPSWKPLIDLARDESDRIVMMNGGVRDLIKGEMDGDISTETLIDADGSAITTTKMKTANCGELRQVSRRDRDVNTVWCVEHLLKDDDDLRQWLRLPREKDNGVVKTEKVLAMEESLGDSGIVMLDTPDPLCKIAPLFDMAEYTIIGLTERKLMLEALDKAAETLYPQIERICEALPGRLWRIYGPEYASPPYLPPELFYEYVTRYVTPMVEMIHKTGGWARLHSHGNLRDILDHIAATGCDALDPIEPPEQGDVELSYVRKNHGKQMVLFGNIEITDIENMPTAKFAEKVRTALSEGTEGEGNGFVLLPSACPYGRKLSALALSNYEKMITLATSFNG